MVEMRWKRLGCALAVIAVLLSSLSVNQSHTVLAEDDDDFVTEAQYVYSHDNEYTLQMLSDGTYEIVYFNEMIHYSTGYGHELVIPSNIDGYKVTSIGSNVFGYKNFYSSVVISEGIVGIQANAFTRADNLVTITFPNTLKLIGAGAFSYCSSLQEVHIPESVQKIESKAFYTSYNRPNFYLYRTTNVASDAISGNIIYVGAAPTPTPTKKTTYTPTPRPTNTTKPTISPTKKPTYTPTTKPTNTPTKKPTNTPTRKPTNTPTPKPTNTPTPKPTNTPTPKPTNTPTPKPTNTPTPKPTNTPTPKPTNTPTPKPTNTPTPKPTNTPTPKPTNTPTPKPTNTPTPKPTNTPTKKPTNTATPKPTNTPTKKATNTPTPTKSAKIPNVVGMYYQDASDLLKTELKKAGFEEVNVQIAWVQNYYVENECKVKQQNPAANANVPVNAKSITVGIYVNDKAPIPSPTNTSTPTPKPTNTATPKPTNTPTKKATNTPTPTKSAKIPNVVGMYYQDASTLLKTELKNAGFEEVIVQIAWVQNYYVENECKVKQQNPSAGATVPVNTKSITIGIYVNDKAPIPSPTNTNTPTPTNTPKPTLSPTKKPTLSPTKKPTNTPKPTNTNTPKPTLSPTKKPTSTPIPTHIPTVTPTPKPLPTKLPTNTPTPTKKPTNTPTPTKKPTSTTKPTPIPTATPTVKPTVAKKPTNTPTSKPTNTPVPTKRPTNTPTNTPTTTPTNTPITKKATVTPTPALSAPYAVTAKTESATSVRLNWTSASNIQYIQVWRATVQNASQSQYSLIGVYNASDKTSLSENLKPNQMYYYKLRGYSKLSNGTTVYSGYSTIVSARPIVPVPQNLRVTDVTSDTVTLNWDKVNGSSILYEVWRMPSRTETPGVCLGRYTDAQKVSTNLKSNTCYYYRVRAYYYYKDADGTPHRIYGDYSSIVGASTI